MGWLRTFTSDRSGTAAAELALALPFILVLILVTLEGGHFLYAEHKVSKGVRDGARYAARLPFSNFPCPSGPIDSTALTQIQQITRTGFPNGDNPDLGGTDNPVLGGWNTGDVTVTVNCVSGQGGLYTSVGGNAPRIRVNASVAYPSLFRIVGLTGAQVRLRAVAESAVMGI